MANLSGYLDALKAKITAQPELARTEPAKLTAVNSKYSHETEINTRLDFLKEFAANSKFEISKAQLKVIYDLLKDSPVSSDVATFFNWCKKSCKAQTILTRILDMDEVASFFTELISTKTLNISTLPVVGFEFLKNYFISANEQASKLVKIKPPPKPVKAVSTVSWAWTKKDDDKKDEADEPDRLQIKVSPSELIDLEIMWKIALESQVEAVYTDAIPFLVSCYTDVDESLEEQRAQFLDILCSRCFNLIKKPDSTVFETKRLAEILKNVVQISEKSGTGGVQPHNAILKGELINIRVKYQIKSKTGYFAGSYKLQTTLQVRMFTSATVWEFKQRVCKAIGLIPKYAMFFTPTLDKILPDTQHGMVMSQLGVKNGDTFLMRKVKVNEVVVP